MKNMNNIVLGVHTGIGKLGFLIKNHIPVLIIFSVTFFVLIALSFFDVATSETILSLSLSEYQVNQIADRTIVAEQSLNATEISPVIVTKGEEIISKGFPITEDRYEKLKKIALTPAYIDFRAFGNAFLFLILLSVLSFFLLAPPILGRIIKIKESIFLATIFIIVYAVTAFGSKVPAFSDPFTLPIIIPSSFFVILIVVMFGERLAVLFSFLLFFVVLYASSFNTVAAIFVFGSCVFAARIVRKMDKRMNLVFAAILLAVLNGTFLFILEIIYGVNLVESPASIAGVALNGFMSGILALGFLTPLEALFNTVSVFRLMDLSDLNHPLMRRMLVMASGTYNHSMMVATLSENACNEIGANGLLARVGAYYHDIGKLEQPEYFVENQTAGNKHDEINPSLSVSIIRNHVKKGVERLNQMHLPCEIIDIVAQHHGNSVIAYFYSEAKKMNPNVSKEDYSYTGTLPTSKEAAVVMIADTVEAACRTLENPSVPRLEKFINQLILSKYESGQLDKADLTFNDLNAIQNSFVTILAGYYHSRIEYPNQKTLSEASLKGSNKTLSEALAKGSSKTLSEAAAKAARKGSTLVKKAKITKEDIGGE